MKVSVPSRTTAGVSYDVVVGLDGTLECNCPASFYPRRGECWHLKFVREELEMTTEMSRALVPIVVQPPTALLHTQHDLDIINNTAAMVFAGGVSLPKELNTKEKVAAVMLYGLELGLRPMTAIQHLYIVEGKVAASAQVMVGLCMNKERDIEFHVEQLDATICTIRMIRPSRHVNETKTITWEQIKLAGLARGNNLQYPEDRLTYHTVKRLCRLYAPDLINGMDEGMAVPGVTESEWRVEAGDLYNEGDAPQLAPANVDRETGEIHEPPRREPESVGRVDDAAPAAASPDQVNEPDVNAMRAAVHNMLVDCKQTWGAKEYGDLFRELSIFMPDGEAKFDPKVIDGERAEACVAYLRERRGEAVPV